MVPLMIESFLKDLRQSLRMFWHSRGFTAAAVSALALGIGANTAIFSVVNAVLLKPVPFPDPERLVLFQTTSPQGNNIGGSPAKFQHMREQTDVRLRGMSVYALPLDEALALARADPMVLAGHLAIEGAEWWTAEGAARFGSG